jgi:hypothetical protein
VKFWYTGNSVNCFHDGSACYTFQGTLPIYVTGRNGQVVHQTHTPEGENGMSELCPTVPPSCGPPGGYPCSGDPEGRFCKWRLFEWTSPATFTVLRIEGGSFWFNWYIDDLMIATEAPPPPCQNPPCEFERARLARDERATGATPATRTSWGRLKQIYQ